MQDVKPGQTWERRSIPGAPWRPVRVENVLRDNVELRYLDLPGAPVDNGSGSRSLSCNNDAPPADQSSLPHDCVPFVGLLGTPAICYRLRCSKGRPGGMLVLLWGALSSIGAQCDGIAGSSPRHFRSWSV